MSARPYSLAWAGIPLVLFVLVPASTACWNSGSFVPDSMACEDAFAKLAGCCPGFGRRAACSVACSDYNFSCDGMLGVSATFPAITGPESDCIREATCEDLRQRGVCERAMVVEDRKFSSVVGNTLTTPKPSSCAEPIPEPAGVKLCL